MIIRAPPERPVIASFAFLDSEVVDASKPQPHQAVGGELPQFVAVAARPTTVFVTPFIGEAYGDPILPAAPNFLDQSIVQFAQPLAPEKRFDGLASLQKLASITPTAVACIGE